MTSIHQSVGCSPIKPSFKSNQDVMTAAADWLESAGLNGYDEASFRDLEGVADKMNDGPIKTFAKIAAIATAAGLAGKKGLQATYNKISNNPQVREHVMTPITKLADKGLQKLTKFINENPSVGKKSIKGFIMTNAKKGMASLQEYAQRGTDAAREALNKQIEGIKKSAANAVRKAAEKDGKTLTDKQVAAEVAKKLSGKSKQAANYQKLVEQRDLAATDNLIQKVTTDIAGVSAGTTAAVAANRDKDCDGIADIGQHKQD